MQLIAIYKRGEIMRYAWQTYKNGFFATIGEAIRYAWAIARQQVRDDLKKVCALAAKTLTDARDNAVKTARRVLGVVREFVLSSASVGEMTVNPATTGSDTEFTITCTRRDVYEGNGQRRKKRAADLRPAMNAAVLSNQIREYRPR